MQVHVQDKMKQSDKQWIKSFAQLDWKQLFIVDKTECIGNELNVIFFLITFYTAFLFIVSRL